MAAADRPGTDEERAEAALIAAAGKILRSGNRDVPEDFIVGPSNERAYAMIEAWPTPCSEGAASEVLPPNSHR